MRRTFLLAVVAMVSLGPWLAPRAFAFATETIGNVPLSELNYTEWKGIMPLVNDKARVYEEWANGNERLFYKGTTKELNKALAHFAKMGVKYHVVVLRPGPAVQQSFNKTAIPFNWELHVLGGLASRYANDNIDDLDWPKDPVLTIYVGGDIDLSKIEVPKGVTWRSAPGQSEEAKKNEAAQKMISEFMEQRKKADR
jgi:hypothetical protein